MNPELVIRLSSYLYPYRCGDTVSACMLLYKEQFFNRRYSAIPFSTYQPEIADYQALLTCERGNALNEPAISKPCGGGLVWREVSATSFPRNPSKFHPCTPKTLL